MKRFLDHAWFNFSRLFQWHRLLGIGGLCLAAYVLVFFVFNNADVGGFIPRSAVPRFHWPDMPQFFTWKSDAKSPETNYTVPTRQLTKEELAQIPRDKPADKSAVPK